MPGGKLSIGQGVRVLSGSHINIHENALLRIEDRVWVGPYNIIYCAESIKIGADSRVSHFCSIIDHNYSFETSGEYFSLPKKSAPIEIGACTWLGAGSTLLKGVYIGNNCVIGANTLLRARTLPSGTICSRTADNAVQSVSVTNRSSQ
jgi:acetyltransferase-like isoleucine patch superfamily enzyme